MSDRPAACREAWRIRTELGNLYLAMTLDENGRPFEVFGGIGELAVREAAAQLPEEDTLVG